MGRRAGLEWGHGHYEHDVLIWRACCWVVEEWAFVYCTLRIALRACGACHPWSWPLVCMRCVSECDSSWLWGHGCLYTASISLSLSLAPGQLVSRMHTCCMHRGPTSCWSRGLKLCVLHRKCCLCACVCLHLLGLKGPLAWGPSLPSTGTCNLAGPIDVGTGLPGALQFVICVVS